MNELIPKSDNSTQNKFLLSSKNIKRGTIIFATISIVTLLGIFLYSGSSNTFKIWSQVDWKYLLLGFLFLINDLFLGGLRNHIFVRELVPGISQWVSIKANLANIFMGAITPSQSGGGPAQIYVYYKNGVKVPDSVSASFFNWISTIIFFPLVGAMGLHILKDNSPSGLVLSLTNFGFKTFSTLLIVMIVALVSPAIIGGAIQMLSKGVAQFHQQIGDRLKNFGILISQKLKEYRSTYAQMLKSKPYLMLWSFLLTILLYFNKFILAVVILWAFGVEADFWVVIAIQAVLYLLLYFSPSPGGSGIAEISIAALMGTIVPNDVIPSFTVLYRSFLVFLPAIIGSIVVLKEVNK